MPMARIQVEARSALPNRETSKEVKISCDSGRSASLLSARKIDRKARRVAVMVQRSDECLKALSEVLRW
jgi:cob(I)alamin adenosyltransferase